MPLDPNMMGSFGDAGAGIGGTIGALIGEAMAAGDYEEAERLMRQASRAYEDIDPSAVVGAESAYDLGPSAYDGMQVDPGTRLMQARVMDELARRGLEGGMDADARADLNEGLLAAAQQERSSRGAIIQDAAARGMGRSGAALAAQLQAHGGAAQRANQAGLRAAADAQARAYQALAQSSDLAGAIRGQDYQQASDKARATDLIAQHNARNRQDVQARNIDRQYQAQQQRFANRMGLADAQNRRRDAMADMIGQRAERKKRVAYGVGSGLGRLGGTAVGFGVGKGG